MNFLKDAIAAERERKERREAERQAHMQPILDRRKRADEAARQAAEWLADRELPANKANRERNEAIAKTNSRDAVRERHQAAEKARVERHAALKLWQEFRQQVEEAATAAEAELAAAVADHDLERAVTAALRMRALRLPDPHRPDRKPDTVLDTLNGEIKKRFQRVTAHNVERI